MAPPPRLNQRRTEDAVSKYAATEGLWRSHDRIVVGVSGGPDSTALLLILAGIRAKEGLHLTAAYFDHQLRGPEAGMTEREAVAALARKLAVDFIAGGANIRTIAAEGHLSIEEAARRARYDFLARAARQAGSNLIAVGHTLDDQAETVVMHLLRGAGLTGMAGMAPRAPVPLPGFPEISIVRPLLHLRREETAAYCAGAGVTALEDPSNRASLYLRNRVRDELMPVMRRYNNDVSGALSRLSESVRADLELIEAQAEKYVTRSGHSTFLDRTTLRPLDPALRRHAIRSAVRILIGDLQGFTQRHWLVLDLAIDGPSGAHHDLPRALVADVLPKTLRLTLRGQTPALYPVEGHVHLSVPGVSVLGSWRFAAASEPLPNAEGVGFVNAAAAGSLLTVRGRRPGDRFQPLGLAGTRKLQDFFTDSHIAREDRDSVPIFETDRGIISVGGLRIAEWARPRPGEVKVCLSYARVESVEAQG